MRTLRNVAAGLWMVCALSLTGLYPTVAEAWESDRTNPYSSREADRQREDAQAQQWNREADQRHEAYRQQVERDRQQAQRAEEQRSYMRLDKDGSQSFCTATSASTTCF